MKRFTAVFCSICLVILTLSSVSFAGKADRTAPVTTASPLGGTFTAPVTVTLTRNEAGTTYYTTNGATPTTSSAVYSSALTFSVTTTLKYFSRDTAGNVETVKTQIYTISTPPTDTTAPVTTASPLGGSTLPVTVTLTRNEAGTTYYTTNGTTPTTSSAVYSAPLIFTTTTTLKYFSRDTAGNIEAVKTQIYGSTPPTGHATMTWTGYGMCSTSTCHAGRANDMHNSLHYQWKGSAAEMTTGPSSQGKLDAVDGSSALNAYCVNIQGTWAPCAACHVGAGARPTSTLTPSNIDCLICHNDTVNAPYSRVRNATSGLFEPAASLNMNLVVQKANIKPVRKNCLGCHAKAGGGDGVKRGDIALASATFSNPADDAHMATGGGNIQCQGCHTFTSHKVIGRGSDLRPQDSATDLNCSSTACHPTKTTATGHTTDEVNFHVGRVACQSCHITTYSRGFLTETDRDWSATAEWNATLNRYEPHHIMEGNLIPKYAFWNGTSWGNNVGDAAVLDPATGAYKISRPNGAINDSASKLYPFKYKTAHQPLAFGKLVALKVGTFFATANYDQAVKEGMDYMSIAIGTPYTTVLADELQVLNHQVEPAGSAMDCSGCHENTTRMNLPAMGYALKAATSVICSQCHREKTPAGYEKIHSHVEGKGFDCSWCHTFSRPERSLTMP